MRIFGPCRSTSTPTAWPALRASERTSSTCLRCSVALPCEKFTRTTSSPASIMRESVFGSLEAGPRVATILVRRGMGGSLLYAARCSSTSTAGSFLPSRNSRKAPPPVEM